MKKILILLAAAIGLSAAAQTTFSGSTLYGYSTNPSYAATLNTTDTLGVAMQLNAVALKQFMGCKITAIAVANGKSLTPAVATMPIKLFAGETLTENFLQEYDGEMNFSQEYKYKEYPLTEPITIDSETPELFFGFKIVCDPKKYLPLVTDAQIDETAGPGDYVGQYKYDSTTQTGSWVWSQLRKQVGMPCLRLKIEGDNLMANNVAIIEHYLPTYTLPGGKAEATLYITNGALNAVESITVTYKCNDSEGTQTYALPSPLLYNEYGGPITFSMDMPDVVGANLPISVTVSGINDSAANNATSSLKTASTMYNSLAEGFDKAVVVEEATGTWCGWCPIGIVGLEKMGELHKDDPQYIPIAAHYNDAMNTSSYNNFFTSSYTGGSFPTCMINRDKETFGVQNPNFDFLKEAYGVAAQIPAVCSVKIKNVSPVVSKKITVDAEVEFSLSTTGDYGLCYVLTEDHVGPYQQANNYAGTDLEWWGKQNTSVSGVYYDHVARYCNTFKGIKSSIPEEVTANTPYTHSATLQTNAVRNIDNAHIIVMVINRSTGRIENAAKISYAEASIEPLTTLPLRHSATDHYYDLQGRRVLNPSHGIYIHNGRKVRL